MPSNHLVHCRPLLLPPSFPASFPALGSFLMSHLFTLGTQGSGASASASVSASVLPMTIKWKSLSCVRLFVTIQSMELSRPEYWSGQPFSLPKGIFPNHGSNPGLPHCGQILYQLSHQRSPGILDWVAYSFSSGSSQPRNWTGVSCIASRFFTNWAPEDSYEHLNLRSFVYQL